MAQVFAFPIEPVSQFVGKDAAIRRPKEIAYFSYDENHDFRLDESSIRYYYPPALPADLNAGFNTFKQLDDSRDDHLDGLLDTIADHERRKGSKVEVDIITWRGMMTKLMVTPFSKLDSWEMNATLFQGTIYLEENHSKKLASKDQQNTQAPGPGGKSQDLMSYWGYKFETLSLLKQQWYHTSREEVEGRESEIVSNHAQYCSVVRTGFGSIKMIIGGEVDAVWDVKPEDASLPVNWVELKTTAEISNDREATKYERKLLKFWTQSFLLGVPRIVVGFRNSDGICHRLEELDTQSIPDRVQKQGKQLWDGQICINFTAHLLEWLKNTITTEGVWRIQRRDKMPQLEVFKLEESGTGDILSRDFLEWRTREMSAIPLGNTDLTAEAANGLG